MRTRARSERGLITTVHAYGSNPRPHLPMRATPRPRRTPKRRPSPLSFVARRFSPEQRGRPPQIPRTRHSPIRTDPGLLSVSQNSARPGECKQEKARNDRNLDHALRPPTDRLTTGVLRGLGVPGEALKTGGPHSAPTFLWFRRGLGTPPGAPQAPDPARPTPGRPAPATGYGSRLNTLG